MVSIVDKLMVDFRGLSTDTKPKAHNGSTFYEMDTGYIYFYSEQTEEWLKQGSGGGGGGGASNLVGSAIVGTAQAG
jgi:hypothetical protein